MKKYALLVFLLSLCLFCTACGSQETPTPVEGLRVYTQRDQKGEPLPPSLILDEEEQRFTLFYSAWSSYAGAGSYTVFSSRVVPDSPKESSGSETGNYTEEGHYLLLKTSDGEHQLLFEKAGDSFIFRAEGSTAFPFAKVEDGAVFR
ncbi:MAG: hypothetical protein Q4B50_00910 [Bacillota bacterium]|nr:hypothetical protein [Bacillota bacterium]